MTRERLSQSEVCSLLGKSKDTVRDRMRATPSHIERPWVNDGTPRRPLYSFFGGKDAVIKWWREVAEWLTSESSDGSGTKSGGSTGPSGGNDRKSASHPRPRKNSSRSSSDVKTSESDTSHAKRSLALLRSEMG